MTHTQIHLRKFYSMNAPLATDHIYDFTTGSVRPVHKQSIRCLLFIIPSPTDCLLCKQPSGFEVWTGTAGVGGSWYQPTALTGLIDEYTYLHKQVCHFRVCVDRQLLANDRVQLNLTYIEPQTNTSRLVNKRPTPRVLKYAWEEYPSAMPIVNAFGLPAAPFNLSISPA